jgi:hypothetical protein
MQTNESRSGMATGLQRFANPPSCGAVATVSTANGLNECVRPQNWFESPPGLGPRQPTASRMSASVTAWEPRRCGGAALR